MQDFDVEQVVRDYLPNIIHMSLGTIIDNKPWVCELHYAYDEQLALYFLSLLSTRHAKEIQQNPYVSGAIVVQHQPGEKPLGVYFEGAASIVKGLTAEDPGLKVYNARTNGRGQFALDEAHDPEGSRLFKITVSDWYVFDARNSKPAQKYHLAWK